MTGYSGFSKPPPGVMIDYTNPLTKNLVGCWLFNEGNGLRVNDVLNPAGGNVGTLVNFEPMHSARGWTGSGQGTALNFLAASNTYVSIPYLNITSASQFTIEIWFRVEPTTAGTMFTEGNTGNNVPVISCDVGANVAGKFSFEERSDLSVDIVTTSPKILSDGLIHQGVGIKVASNLRLAYTDGSNVASGTTNLAATTTNNNRIGIWQRTGFIIPYLGPISMVRVWKGRALTAQEVQQLYNNPFEMFKYKAGRNARISAGL